MDNRLKKSININFLILIFVLWLCKRLPLFLGKGLHICSKGYMGVLYTILSTFI